MMHIISTLAFARPKSNHCSISDSCNVQVITQLQQQFKIEPCFTQLVWQKLEEQNQEFFRAYYTRLKLKDQIVLFNHLLDEQVKMFERMPRSNLATGRAQQ